MPDYRPTVNSHTTENRKVAYTHAMLSIENEIKENVVVPWKSKKKLTELCDYDYDYDEMTG